MTSEHLFKYDLNMPRSSKLGIYFKKIQRFYETKKRMPSFSETAHITGVKSKNAVFQMVNRMSKLGLLAKDETGRLIPGDDFNGVRVLGYVEAGFPSPAEEELLDTMTLDEYLVKNREATFMLKIKGDSMIEAGIMPGDMVLVERGNQAREGDIVIAEIDGAWTIKFLKKKAGKICLVPGNKKYQPIFPRDELNIAAVVKAVVRKY